MEQLTHTMPANNQGLMTSSECQMDGTVQVSGTDVIPTSEKPFGYDSLYMECDDDSGSESHKVKTEPVDCNGCVDYSEEDEVVSKQEDIAFSPGNLGQNLLDLKVELDVRQDSSDEESCDVSIKDWSFGAAGANTVGSNENVDERNAGAQDEKLPGTDKTESRYSADYDEENGLQSNSESEDSSNMDTHANIDHVMDNMLMDYGAKRCSNNEMKATVSQKRKTYSIEFKLCVVDYAKEHSHRKTARTFGIHRKNVSAWTHAENLLRFRQQNLELAGKRSTGAGRKIHDPGIERELLLWIIQKREAGVRVTGRMLQQECLRRYRLKGDDKFKASEQWLRKFKKRNRMLFEQTSHVDLAERRCNENMQVKNLPNSEPQHDGSDPSHEPQEEGKAQAESSGSHPDVRDRDCADSDQIDNDLNQELNNHIKRNSYSVDFKIKVLEYASAHSNTAAAKIFGVSRKGVTDWRKEEQELRFRNETERNKYAKRKPGAGKKILDINVEAALLKWVFDQRSMGLEINAKQLKSESLRRHVEHGYKEFKASSGWLQRFRERNNVLLQRSPRVNKPRGMDCSAPKASNQRENCVEENDVHSTVFSGKEPGTCLKSFNLDNELELLQWIAQRSKSGLQITPRNLKEECTRIHEQTGNPEYTASDSWLRNFQKRNGISFRKTNKNSKNVELVFGEKNHAFDIDGTQE